MPILTIPSEICALAVGATMLAVARVAISASRNRTALTLVRNLASARRVSSHLIRHKRRARARWASSSGHRGHRPGRRAQRKSQAAHLAIGPVLEIADREGSQ